MGLVSSSEATAFMRALESGAKQERLIDGFKSIVEAYFDEYEDAETLDGETYKAINHLWEVCFQGNEADDGTTLEDVLNARPAR